VLLANGTNAAKGKTAMSTTFTTGRGPSKAVDGDKATNFQGALPANTDGGYWKLDLGAAGVSGAAAVAPPVRRGSLARAPPAEREGRALRWAALGPCPLPPPPPAHLSPPRLPR
jgi:hypothetical protein